jgi:putative restriction endonuclease
MAGRLARHPLVMDVAAAAGVAAGTGLIDAPPAERLDLRNGLAACPAHDVAFDTGLLTVNGGLRIHLASRLTNAVQGDPLARQYYGRPPLQQTLLFPPGARAPARKYLDWHRTYVFAA